MALKVLLAGVVAVLIFGTAAGFYFGMARTTTNSMHAKISSVTIGTSTITVEVADTPASRSLGLSGRASLADGSGLLFIFDTAGDWGFWMKDMQFSIDILFIDAEGTVSTVHSDVSPQTYQQNPPQVFHPRAPALYVLEVPAGYAKAHNINEGSKVTFNK